MIAIAIDGPSGAGKSTLARRIATIYGCIYVDTGAIYRSLGLYMLQNEVPINDASRVAGTLDKIDISLGYDEGEQRVYLNGTDVSDKIRTPEVSMAASAVSAVPEVRSFLLNLQRDIAKKHDVVMDGRDIGTVILPRADVKIFLTAAPEDRARRRYEELLTRGERVSFEETLAAVIKRDENDCTRAAAPLCAAPDAIVADTTGYSLEQSEELLHAIIEREIARFHG